MIEDALALVCGMRSELFVEQVWRNVGGDANDIVPVLQHANSTT